MCSRVRDPRPCFCFNPKRVNRAAPQARFKVQGVARMRESALNSDYLLLWQKVDLRLPERMMPVLARPCRAYPCVVSSRIA